MEGFFHQPCRWLENRPWIHSQWMYGSRIALAKFHCYVSFPEQHWINLIESAHFLTQKTNMTMEKTNHLKMYLPFKNCYFFHCQFCFSGGKKSLSKSHRFLKTRPEPEGVQPLRPEPPKPEAEKGMENGNPKFIAVWNMDHESGDSWMYPDQKNVPLCTTPIRKSRLCRALYRSYISGYSWIIIPKNPERTESIPWVHC